MRSRVLGTGKNEVVIAAVLKEIDVGVELPNCGENRVSQTMYL